MILAFSLVATAVAAAPAFGPWPRFLRDAAETKSWTLGRPTSLRPTPDGSAVLFLRSPARDPTLALYELEVASGKTRALLTPADILHGAEEQLSVAERARRERARMQAKGFTSFDLSPDGRTVLVMLSGHLYAVARADGKVRQLTQGDDAVLDPQLSPDGRFVAYVRRHDLFVTSLATGREKQLTRGGTAEVSHGVAEFVAEEEMDRFHGFWWAPDSSAIAFEEADARAVERFTIADPAHPERAAQTFPYPRPGRPNVKARLGLARLAGGKPTWVAWDRERFPYLARVLWKEGTAPLTLLVQAREQKRQQLLTVDATSGRTHLLLEQTDDAWLNLSPDVPAWLPDGSGLVYSVDEQLGRALMFLPKSGKDARVVVPAALGFERLAHLPRTGKDVYVLVAPTPTNVQLAKAPLDSGEPETLSREAISSERQVVFSKNGKVYVETRVTAAALPESTVFQVDGTKVAPLTSVAEAPPFQPNLELTTVQGERPYEVAIVRPRDFDAKKKYPVIDAVYGGPHYNIVRADEGMYLLNQWIADHGVIVVSVDNRGTPRRGRTWEQAIAGSFGEVPLHDQVDALHALAEKYPEMDLARVGVFGWSFGGYLSALAVLRRPDVFKVAVAGAPVVDWHDYDTHYTERYLGTPDSNAKGYDESSLLTYAPALSRPLLIIHGTADDNVYFFHSLKLAHALFAAGKPFDFLPLSGTHMVADPTTREHLWQRIIGFLLSPLGITPPQVAPTK